MRILSIVFLMLAALSDVSAQDGFAVVELFTSQGCSSCPSADKNLSELLNKASNDNKEVYGLSFHVDYWNYIGWKDPYSNKAFSERQRDYAKLLGTNVYTPQMVVNGKEVFVGSDRNKAQHAIGNAQSQKHNCKLEIADVIISKGTVTFDYSVDKVSGNELLNVALVERNIANYVSRGENNGRTLHHDNVVRAFETIALKKSGRLQIALKDEKLENCSIILYVQDKNLTVVTAGTVKLSGYLH